ncbi:MAG: aromatic amino acid hydroxylase [Bdellovibrionaceae bacterium]|nr:aromatic amino acid hydroxylase [Pseudobdellovibrionaceae bacterium]
MELPKHLARYCVEQDYSRYTPVDQAAWRHIMRQLKSYLSVHAHPSYLDGLRKTGIETDQIPSIAVMNERLQAFGWQAVPVSGFIPPAAFMELQSLGVLPIASDMRTVEHMHYTPAPDIVHEAAGHAPILVDPAFAAYLKAYASVARKAIISKHDMDQYEAIRVLSDLKEDPSSTAEQVKSAEENLSAVSHSISELSEAALLGRMNWWTAEYGLIGDLNNPKIFGAGLLSSIGEARSCLNPSVKKIPLTIDCIKYAYDITEQQPQLFVVPEFSRLGEVLEELAAQMAFRVGGTSSLEKARRAETVNTVELNTGIQISGRLKSYETHNGEPAYLSFEGPTQLAMSGYEIHGQGTEQHTHGFGSPVGDFELRRGGEPISIEDAVGFNVSLHFTSGVLVEGRLRQVLRNRERKVALMSFATAQVTRGSKLLFDPSWGEYDMTVGTTVTSVYGGPADREAYGETEDFTRKLVPRRTYSAETLALHTLYRDVRKAGAQTDLDALYGKSKADDWLIRCEILEQAERFEKIPLIARIRNDLAVLAQTDKTVAGHIDDALRTLHLK